MLSRDEATAALHHVPRSRQRRRRSHPRRTGRRPRVERRTDGDWGGGRRSVRGRTSNKILTSPGGRSSVMERRTVGDGERSSETAVESGRRRFLGLLGSSVVGAGSLRVLCELVGYGVVSGTNVTEQDLGPLVRRPSTRRLSSIRTLTARWRSTASESTSETGRAVTSRPCPCSTPTRRGQRPRVLRTASGARSDDSSYRRARRPPPGVGSQFLNGG